MMNRYTFMRRGWSHIHIKSHWGFSRAQYIIGLMYLHFQIANDTKKDKKYSRVVFMENLQDQMINVDWADKIRRFNMSDSDDESYSPDGFWDKTPIHLMR